MSLKELIASSADPATAEYRLDLLIKNPSFEKAFNRMSSSVAKDFIQIISFSSFLYNYISQHSFLLNEIGSPVSDKIFHEKNVRNIDDLKLFKYEQLLKITWMDFSRKYDYVIILQSLSLIAEFILNQTLRLSLEDDDYKIINKHMATFALGKLGAGELNFSSDIDLVFVCSNLEDVELDIFEYQKILQDSIRKLSYQLENKTAEGFLYRVDLKLRPWGDSGPLVMTVDETENYYEASSQAWERFAWLRARSIMGSNLLSSELQNRLQPFIYRGSLSSDDIERFVDIKNEMTSARKRKGYWNVKVGEGGIRDIEFYIQLLQIVNAHSNHDLQITGTLNILSKLNDHSLVSDKEASEIRHSYLFLRRLENHLQMIDERQTHSLSDDIKKRIVIAKSLGIFGESDDEIIDNFETELFLNSSIAKNYFERLLP